MIAQIDTKLDSLIKVNQNYLFEDTVKINLQIEIADLSMRSNPEKSIQTINEAIRISNKINQPLFQAQAYRIKGKYFMNQRNFSESINCFSKALNIFEKIGLKEKVANQNAFLGYLWSQNGDIRKGIDYYKAGMEIYKLLGMHGDQANCLGWMAQNFAAISDTSTALKLFTQAIDINKKVNNTQGLINNYNDLSIMYNVTGAYIKAIAYSQNALKLCELNKDETSMANTLLNIGAIYYYIHDINKFNEYSKRALELFKKLDDSYNIAKTSINIGSAYKELKDYQQAYNYHIQAQEILEKFNDKNTLAKCYGNLGEILREQKKIIESIRFHNKALNLYDAENDKPQIATTLYNLIILYQNAPDDILKQIGLNRITLSDTAKSLALKALTLSNESLDPFLKWRILKELSSIYEHEGDYKNAYATYAQFTKLRDSLSNDEVKLEINRKEIQYEFDKKEATLVFEKKITIAQLEKQNILSEKQRQDLKIKDQLIIISNAKNKISHLAYLKEKSEKTEKEQQLLLSEKDKLLQASQLNILGNEKKIQLQHLASQKSTIGFLLAGLIVILLSSIIYYLWLQHRQSQKEAIIQSKFTQRLFESTEDERGRIARDLHDGLSHELLT
ncbi:MAG: tetratricopeptide repeat protein, partial [Saprospiraceae bacterium]